MNRSTPSRAAGRAERQDRNSPYARPAADSKLKRSGSLVSFPGIRSLVSYITHPFARSPASKGLPMTNADIDQKSESGSEDGWNGKPEQQMQEADVFALAAANGHEGPDLEKRSASWRAGEKPGGRRDTARKELQLTATPVQQPLISPTMPGHLAPGANGAIPANGALTNGPSFGNAVSSFGNSLKRRFSPTKADRTLPVRSPLPTFAPATPVAPIPTIASNQHPQLSASSLALKAFVDAKNGHPLTEDDVRVIKSLTENARHEAEAGGLPTQHTPQAEVGGWAAGQFTPRPIKALPSTYTPVRPAGSAFGTPAPATPGIAFSMGLSPARTANGTPGRTGTPGSVRYIGPGWSAKRMYPQAKSNLKPLFTFNLEDEGIAKKRRVGEFESGAHEAIPPVPPIPTSISMPNFASSSASSRTLSNAKAIDILTSIVKESPKHDPVSVGKRRAADIMLDLIRADAAKEPEREKEAPPPFIVNPYHPDAYTLVSAGSPAPASPMRNGTPRKSILKGASGSSTPLRGAAKRLEEAKNAAPTPKKMTALEMLTQQRPGGGETRSPVAEREGRAKGKGKASAAAPAEPEEVDMEDKSEKRGATDSMRAVEAAIGAPAKRVRIAEPAEESEPEPFKPFTAPQLSGTSLPLPSASSTSSSFTPTSSFSFTAPAPSSGLVPAAAALPKFTPSPLSISTMPDEPKFNIGSTSSTNPSTTTAGQAKMSVEDLSKIYLSAKDTALAITKEALPFFTFDLNLGLTTSDSDSDSEMTKRAKEEAMKRSLGEYAFNLDASSAHPMPKAPVPVAESALMQNKGFDWGAATGGKGPAVKAGGAAEWTCGTCMCKSPDNAQKCAICDEPRPKAAGSAPAPSQGFDWAAATGGKGPAVKSGGEAEWTCGTCMCKSPDSAQKCAICDEPRPKAAGSAAPASSQGFDWAAATGGKAPAAKAGGGAEWTCGTCFCKSPESATKCTVCDEARG